VAAPEASSSREKILDTAEVLFARHGFAGVGLREVAERVGLGKSSLFHHFPTKARLYAAVLERVIEQIDERLESARGDSPGERFERWVDALIDAVAQDPARARLLLRSLFEQDVLAGSDAARLDAGIERLIGRARDLLRSGIEAGVFRDVSIPHAIQTLIGLTVYHFASGEFGDGLLGSPVYSAAEVQRRRREVRDLLRWGLSRRPEGESS
jgi:AcrR family transcriptional regulator